MDALLQLIIVLLLFAVVIFLIGRSTKVIFLLGICLAGIFIAAHLGLLEGIL